jgi:FtsH-binding integral membrane protein
MYVVAQDQPQARAEFIRKTYAHLAGAVGAFIAIETLLVQSGIAAQLAQLMTGGFTWLAVLAGFSLLGWFSRGLASKADSVSLQYAGLAIYVVAEALLFAPIIYIASMMSDASVIPTAGILTVLMFVGLTTVALTTGKDFSFLGGALKIGGFVALGAIVCSVIFKFQLGVLFSVLMVGFAMAAILYDTSKIMNNFSKDQYVAASLELFASVALLFWYILQIVMSMSRR